MKKTLKNFIHLVGLRGQIALDLWLGNPHTLSPSSFIFWSLAFPPLPSSFSLLQSLNKRKRECGDGNSRLPRSEKKNFWQNACFKNAILSGKSFVNFETRYLKREKFENEEPSSSSPNSPPPKTWIHGFLLGREAPHSAFHKKGQP